jgi:uncharacterized protein with von Willebrand factor type A (vWA) domain
VAKAVPDWSGGTRIGDAIGAYNREWSRRVGGGGPIVLIISDGWDTGDPDHLALEMRRLGRAAHKVMWLNPLAGRLHTRGPRHGCGVAQRRRLVGGGHSP